MKTITLCGSMKFAGQMKQIAWQLETKQGFHVLQCAYNEQDTPITDYALKHLTLGSL